MWALFLLLGLLLIHTWFGPDIWYHLTWGRSLWEKQSLLPDIRTLIPQPLEANPYWLFQLAMHGLYSLGGVWLVSFFFMGLWILIAWIWSRLANIQRTGVLGLVSLLIFVLLAQTRFEARPEIWSYLFLCLSLSLLLRRPVDQKASPWSMLALFLIQAVWLNSHSYFIVGFAVSWVSGSFRYAVVSGLACLLSPFGPYLWISLWNYVQFGSQMKDWIHELMPPVFTVQHPLIWFWLLLGMLVVYSAALIYFWVKSSFQVRASDHLVSKILWFAIGAFAALQATRNIPLFFILSAPLLGDLLLAAHQWLKRQTIWRPTFDRWGGGVVMGGSAILAYFVVSGTFHRWIYSPGQFGFGVEKAAVPVQAVEYLKSIGFQGHLFTDSYDGGYIQFMMPDVRVAGDSYFADADATLRFFAAIKNPKALEDLNRDYSFDALLINIENLTDLQPFLSDLVWRMVYADSHRAVFVNRGRFQHAQFQIEKTNLYDGQDLRHWVYAFGVNTWAGFCLSQRNEPLMENLIAELLSAPHIPATAVRFALQLGVIQKNQKIVLGALALSRRAFDSEPGEVDKLKEEILRSQER